MGRRAKNTATLQRNRLICQEGIKQNIKLFKHWNVRLGIVQQVLLCLVELYNFVDKLISNNNILPGPV